MDRRAYRSSQGNAADSRQASQRTQIRISGPLAKKIVDGRPYRSKRELVTRQVLTEEQYKKFKDSLVARRARNSKK